MNAESIILSSESSTSTSLNNGGSLRDAEQNNGKQTFGVTLQASIDNKKSGGALTEVNDNKGAGKVRNSLATSKKIDNENATNILPLDGENKDNKLDASDSLNSTLAITEYPSRLNYTPGEKLPIESIALETTLFSQDSAKAANIPNQGSYVPVSDGGMTDSTRIGILLRDIRPTFVSQLGSVQSLSVPETQQGIPSTDILLEKKALTNGVVNTVSGNVQLAAGIESLELNSKLSTKEITGMATLHDKFQDQRPQHLLELRAGLQQHSDAVNKQPPLGVVNFYSQLQNANNNTYNIANSNLESNFLTPWDKKTLALTGDLLNTNSLSTKVTNKVDIEGLYSISGQQLNATQTLPKSFYQISGVMTDPRWGDELSGKLHVLLQNNLQQAQFHINPRNLGPLDVRIAVGQDQQVSIGFNVSNAIVKEALDMAMPKLREMLLEQGLNLSNVDVGQKSTNQHKNDQQNMGSYSANLEREVDHKKTDTENTDDRNSDSYSSGNSLLTLDVFV